MKPTSKWIDYLELWGKFEALRTKILKKWKTRKAFIEINKCGRVDDGLLYWYWADLRC